MEKSSEVEVNMLLDKHEIVKRCSVLGIKGYRRAYSICRESLKPNDEMGKESSAERTKQIHLIEGSSDALAYWKSDVWKF
jgi:hypothetical protein